MRSVPHRVTIIQSVPLNVIGHGSQEANMTTPVRATPGQVVNAGTPPTDGGNLGSYPAELTADQFAWLHERAAQTRLRWAEHAQALACNQKS
jgi:hypothetical protein